MGDIRTLLQLALKPDPELDEAISKALGLPPASRRAVPQFSTDYNHAIAYIESKDYDWIMGNVNGQVGGTPYGCVGVSQDQASYSGTALLSLWLSYFRLELGDERPGATVPIPRRRRRAGFHPESDEAAPDVRPPMRALIDSGRKVYAIGYHDEKNSTYGMVWGPTEDLGDCMSYHPNREAARDRDAHLLRLLPGGNHEVVYVWDWDRSDWQEPPRK